VIEWLAQSIHSRASKLCVAFSVKCSSAAMTRPSPSKRSPAAKPRASFLPPHAAQTDVSFRRATTTSISNPSTALNIALQRYEGTVFLVSGTTTTSSTKSPPASGTSITATLTIFKGPYADFLTTSSAKAAQAAGARR